MPYINEIAPRSMQDPLLAATPSSLWTHSTVPKIPVRAADVNCDPFYSHTQIVTYSTR